MGKDGPLCVIEDNSVILWEAAECDCCDCGKESWVTTEGAYSIFVSFLDRCIYG
jgi:hypothetical protein